VRGDYENDTFNLDGSVASVTSLGFNVGYTYGGAAQPLKATHSSTNVVTGATYAPPGELTGMTLGSATGFTGITVNNAYNDRLQPILLSAASPSGTLFSECFDFHLGVAVNTAPCSFSASTTGDNGNVYQIVNKRNSARSQSFTYDSLNRIGSGYSSGTQWGETYTIDAWGNLTNRAGVTGKTNSEPLSVSAGTNNQLSGFGYDAAGNMTSNSSINASYVYDAENRLIATAGYSYLYDGDGQRVEKCTEGPTPGACATSATGTLYWRGSASDALSETDLAGNVQNTYVFFNGQRVARQDSAGAIHYYFSDHLGSHGVVENATGSVCEQDIDYYPYGGQQHNYCPNAAQNYKFTGKERDSESGLDNFGARFNASNIGRFMSPDAFFKDSHVSDPQSWNEYAYVRNNPLRYTDPNGEKATVYTDCGPDGQGGTWCHVTVSASIVIYSVNGTTTEQLKQAQSAITSQIDKAWSGSFTQDGTTYNVTTNVTVSIASSADAAFNSGAQNAVGISTNADVQSHLEAGPRGSGQDRGVWDFSSITSGQLAPHEFSHALGLDDNHGNNLSNSFSNASMGDHPHATAQDFQWAFGPELHNHQANFTVGQREGRACPFCNNRGNRHWWEVFPEQTEHK